MKIAVIADTFSIENGTGIARYGQELLAGLNKKDLYAQPIYTKPPKLPFGGTANHLFRLPHRILKETINFDIIHATSPACAFSFPLIKKAKKIVTYHDLTSFACEGFGFPLYTKLFNPFLYRILANNSDKIIAVSAQTKEDLVNYLKIPTEKIVVIHQGVDERFRPMKKEEKNFSVIGYVGALAARKRVDSVIRAFYYFRKSHPELQVKLSICGNKTQEYSKLIELAKELKLEKTIEFKGFVADEKLVEAYNSFDVFVMPSEWEGFCIPILEAQRCGTPVIIRENAHIPSEVTKYCLKAKAEKDMAEKMYELLTNPSLREKSAQAGLEYSGQFTWGKTVDQTLKVYSEVCQE